MRFPGRLTITVALSVTAALPVSMARAGQGQAVHAASDHRSPLGGRVTDAASGHRVPLGGRVTDAASGLRAVVRRQAARPAAARATLSFTGAQVSAASRTPARDPGDADTQAAQRPAPVTLVASPASPRVGQRVRLALLHPPTGASNYSWSLGPGELHADLGLDGPTTEARFRSTGVRSVTVRFKVGDTVRAGALKLDVRPRAASTGSPPAASPSASAHSRHAGSAARTARVTAHAAGDPGVTIADFQFSPATTTIHAGDTITWTNNGPSSHTATARNGSFDTGVLKQGQSASHTFTQPGTYTFFCQIHPFMHGTIVVLASTTTTTTTPTTTTPTQTQPAGSTATTSSSTATAAAASTKPTLPLTGWNVFEGLVAGLLLFGIGSAIRRLLAR